MSYIYGAHILDVSRSQTTTHHSRYDSSGRVISSTHRPLPDNTRHSQHTKITRKWRKNTAGRWHRWRLGVHAVDGQVPLCWSLGFNWTPFCVCIYLTIGMLNSCFRKATFLWVWESLYVYAYNEIKHFKRKAVTSDKLHIIYCRVVSWRRQIKVCIELLAPEFYIKFK